MSTAIAIYIIGLFGGTFESHGGGGDRGFRYTRESKGETKQMQPALPDCG
jgi:hypothetical protein